MSYYRMQALRDLVAELTKLTLEEIAERLMTAEEKVEELEADLSTANDTIANLETEQ
jgi:hypothetical protein